MNQRFFVRAKTLRKSKVHRSHTKATVNVYKSRQPDGRLASIPPFVPPDTQIKFHNKAKAKTHIPHICILYESEVNRLLLRATQYNLLRHEELKGLTK